MITAGELCKKIIVKEMIENEKKVLKQKLDAQKFIKEVIEPIVDNLSEIPKNYLIGYVYLTYNSNPDNIVYKNLSNWQRGITASGYEKETRHLENCVFEGVTNIDFDIINNILKNYGFILNIEEKEFVTVHYTSHIKNGYNNILEISLDLLCDRVDK